MKPKANQGTPLPFSALASSVASPDDATDDIAVAPTRTRDDSTDAAAQTTSASPDDAATNASQPPKKKKKKKKARVTQYIACHHFDPAILEAMLEQDLATIDLIPAELIEHLGLVDNGYTNEDMVRGDGSVSAKNALKVDSNSQSNKVEKKDEYKGPWYVPTPSYKHARRDYEQASTRYRLNELIKKCRGGNSTLRRQGDDDDTLRPVVNLARQGDDDILRPVVKLARIGIDPLPPFDYESIDDLRRAVCMLSEPSAQTPADSTSLVPKIRRPSLS